jgi:hypothetical protein
MPGTDRRLDCSDVPGDEIEYSADQGERMLLVTVNIKGSPSDYRQGRRQGAKAGKIKAAAGNSSPNGVYTSWGRLHQGRRSLPRPNRIARKAFAHLQRAIGFDLI